MNKSIKTIVGLLVLTGAAFAGDKAVDTKDLAKDICVEKSDCEARKLELRLGPTAFLNTGTIKIGTGNKVDVADDLKLDDPGVGIKFDSDWQFLPRWHFTSEVLWNHYSQSGRISGDWQYAKDKGYRSGSTVKVDTENVVVEGAVGYDLISNKTYILKPYIGVRGFLATGSISGSGTAFKQEVNYADNSKDSFTKAAVTYLVGVDQKVYIARNWYIGADCGGSTLGSIWEINGDGYTGYDFNKTWGLRTGYAFDYADVDKYNSRINALNSNFYVQLVCGF